MRIGCSSARPFLEQPATLASFRAGKTVFDQAADIRNRAGKIRYPLLHFDNDANNIVHFSVGSSLDNARRFFESSEWVDIREKAGVKSPEFMYLQQIAQDVPWRHPGIQA